MTFEFDKKQFDTYGIADDWSNRIKCFISIWYNVKDTLQGFSSLKTNKARIAFVLDMIKENPKPKFPNGRSKSIIEANRLRRLGNECFQKQLLETALLYYHDSIVCAMSGSEELALAFGNCSAVLFNMRFYLLCTTSVDCAVEEGFPVKSLHKLYLRKAWCFQKLGRESEGKLCLEQAVEYLSVADLNALQHSNINRDIEKLKQLLDRGCAGDILSVNTLSLNDACKDDSVIGDFADMRRLKDCPSLGESNSVYPSLAANCTVASDCNQGRFITAVRDIEPGEVILVEIPYASVLFPDNFRTHCHNCMKRLYICIPCPSCTIVRFCSLDCRNKATYHDIECSIMPMLLHSGLQHFALLGTRCITGTPKEELFSDMAEQEVTHTQDIKSPNEMTKYLASDYDRIKQLVTNDDKRSDMDLFSRALYAIFIMFCLQKVGFFQNEVEANHVASLLLTHNQAIGCNSLQINELHLNQTHVAFSVREELGAGLYSTLSLFNHSCALDVSYNFYGSVCVVRALRKIAKGQPVSFNYGLLYGNTPRDDRQKKLQRTYLFQCTCDACKFNWPVFDFSTIVEPVLRCQHCRTALLFSANTIKCYKCNTVNDCKRMKNALLESGSRFEMDWKAFQTKPSVSDLLPKFLKHQSVLDQLVCRPFPDYDKCQEAITLCYSILANCYIKPT